MRTRMVVAFLAAGLLLPGSAPAMLPASEAGWRPAHPSDCRWPCVKERVPARFKRLAAAQRALVEESLEPNRRMLRLSQELQKLQLQMALQREMLEKITEATWAVVRNARNTG